MLIKRDYYETLQVDKNSSSKEIKRAFRKLAMIYHPDQAKGDKQEAERLFKEINEAHSVLSDPNKRNSYDRFGHNANFNFSSHSNVTYTTFNGKSKKTIIQEKLKQNRPFDISNFSMELNVHPQNLEKIIRKMISNGMSNGKITNGQFIPS